MVVALCGILGGASGLRGLAVGRGTHRRGAGPPPPLPGAVRSLPHAACHGSLSLSFASRAPSLAPTAAAPAPCVNGSGGGVGRVATRLRAVPEEGAPPSPREFQLFSQCVPRDVQDEYWAWRMWQYWGDQGCKSSKQRGRMVAVGRGRTMFRDTSEMDSRMREIGRVLELDQEQTVKVVIRAPMLATRDIPTFADKMALLEALLPGADIQSIIRRVPTLLYKDIDKNVGTHIAELRELLPEDYNVQKILQEQPSLLYSDITGTVKKNFENLQALVPGAKSLKGLVEATPSLLNTNIVGTAAPKLRRLETYVGRNQLEQWMDHPASLGRALRCSNRVIDRLQYIHETSPGYLQYSPISILTMVGAKFEETYPGYAEWVDMRSEQGKFDSERRARQAARMAGEVKARADERAAREGAQAQVQALLDPKGKLSDVDFVAKGFTAWAKEDAGLKLGVYGGKIWEFDGGSWRRAGDRRVAAMIRKYVTSQPELVRPGTITPAFYRTVREACKDVLPEILHVGLGGYAVKERGEKPIAR